MLVTFTNISAAAIYLSQLYRGLAPGEAVQTQRHWCDLEKDAVLKAHIQANEITLGFTLEATDSVGVGSGPVPLNYTDISRPNPNLVPVFTSIWNTDDNALNWSDGANWRDASGVIT